MPQKQALLSDIHSILAVRHVELRCALILYTNASPFFRTILAGAIASRPAGPRRFYSKASAFSYEERLIGILSRVQRTGDLGLVWIRPIPKLFPTKF